MSVRTYNPNVRVGNWNEDIQLEEDTLKDFLERRKEGKLLIQRSGGLAQSILKKCDFSISRDGYVHYGDRLMLMNPAAGDQTKHIAGENPRQASSLSMVMADGQMDGPCRVSGSINCNPSARNTFLISSIDGSKNGDCLTYNTPFYLVSAESNLLLCSDHVTFQKSARKSRHQDVQLVSEPSKLTAWRVQPFDPLSRLEMENMPVPANSKVIVNHVYTNRNLCVEQNCLMRTPFGREYEIAAHTYFDSHKAEADVHHWVMTMGVPGSDVMPVPPQGDTQKNTPSQDQQNSGRAPSQ